MAEHEASRTLVKSAPELWAECSDPVSLARHLGAFGEIRITKLEPETAVAWEGDDVSGTVTLEPSGWGTRVILTATVVPGEDRDLGESAVVEYAPVVEEPAAVEEPAIGEPVVEPEPELGLLARLFGRWRAGTVADADPDQESRSLEAPEDPQTSASPEPRSDPEPAGPPELAPVEPLSPQATALVEALESLGMAHRRPFSRA